MDTLTDKTNRAFFKQILDDLNRKLYDFDIRLERLEKRLANIEIIRIESENTNRYVTDEDLFEVRDVLWDKLEAIESMAENILKNSEKSSWHLPVETVIYRYDNYFSLLFISIRRLLLLVVAFFKQEIGYKWK